MSIQHQELVNGRVAQGWAGERNLSSGPVEAELPLTDLEDLKDGGRARTHPLANVVFGEPERDPAE